jgi:chemotaxis protein MotB
MAISARRNRGTPDIWPGFVDAISALLIIVIFLLMVFTLAQFFLSELLSGRDEALERLNGQISELSEMLSLERGANAELRGDLAQISAQLQTSVAARDRLSSQLAEILPERDALTAAVGELTRERDSFSALLAERTGERDDLATKLTDATSVARVAADRAEKVSAELADAFKSIEADKGKIEIQLRHIASMERDIDTLGVMREKLEKQVADLAVSLKARDKSLASSNRELAGLRDRSKELVARLATAKDRTVLVQKDIDEKDVRLKKLLARASKAEIELTKEQRISIAARRATQLLNVQLVALRRQLARLESALEVSEAKSEEQGAQIVNLGKRLNQALASKVEELAHYRSEFFGELRKVLGNRQGIRIVGDRFVFQSEVLFSSGKADLQEGGQQQITQLAKTLLEISRKIPKKLNWVLRVDGHTDKIPIKTSRFPSNWELSTARAISVVRHLIERGIPPGRLAATGFGEFQPLDARDDETAYRRNRRIEFKLTER